MNIDTHRDVCGHTCGRMSRGAAGLSIRQRSVALHQRIDGNLVILGSLNFTAALFRARQGVLRVYTLAFFAWRWPLLHCCGLCHPSWR